MAADRFKYFRIEAREILDGLAKGVLDLEKRPDGEVIARLLRHAHTLKGAARIVGHRELSDLAHEMEDVLAALRDAPSQQRLDAALALVDQMSVHVTALQHPEPAPARAGTAADAKPDARTDAKPGANTGDARPTEPARDGDARALDTPAPRADPTTVDDVLSGLAEIHAQIRRLRGIDDVRAIEQRVDQLERELRAVRQDAERLRLLPAGMSFTSLERTARDVARSAGRRVAFATSGGEVRVDAHVLTTLHGALVQLVRNAVAHGIEPPEERVAAGKPADGRVSIAVGLQGSRIAITCRDDGRGLDLEAVRRSAVRRGLAPDRARALDRDQLIELLLRGGITTSAAVTTFAGRGIGLDVVRDAADRLGGTVQVTSEPGAGTVFGLDVPVSLAALAALALDDAGVVAAIPLDAVRRALRVHASELTTTPAGPAVMVDGELLPFLPLGAVLGRGTPVRAGAWSAVVVEDRGRRIALGAGRLLRAETIVVRPLPELAPCDPVIAGASLDADGNPQLVLDPAGLVATCARPLAEPDVHRPRILVVDDSVTTRMLEQSILEAAGYQVDLAVSGEDGLVRARATRYALFLVDVDLPGIDGFTFVESVQRDPALRATPAILVTSRASPADRARGREVGARGYIAKGDFDQNALLEQIACQIAPAGAQAPA